MTDKERSKHCPEYDGIGLQRKTWPLHSCSCSKAAGHSGKHKCPICNRDWNHYRSRADTKKRG